MTSLCLEICGERSFYGMSLDVKAYRSVDLYAPIMEYAREGNVQAIQEMFSKGTATPHDTWRHRETVLSIAAQSGQIEVCRLLIEQGAHQHARHAYFRVLNFGNPLQELKSRLGMIRILAGAVQDDDFFGFHPEISAINGFHGEPTLLNWILNNLIGYNYQKATIEGRMRVAIHLCARTRQPRAASLVRFLLPKTHDISSMCNYIDSYGRTLLHSLAWALGEQSLRATQSSKACRAQQTIESPSGFKYDAQAESDSLQGILSLMSEQVVAGADLHNCAKTSYNVSNMSPAESYLVCILSSFSQWRRDCMILLDYRFETINSEFDAQYMLPVPAVVDVLVPVTLWLEMLYDAGVDLVKYGRKEKELRQEGRTTSHCSFEVWPWDFLHPRLIGTWRRFDKEFWISFEYGPKPSDWQFWLIEEMDDWFAEFWDMLDHPERAMPGAWDERFDDSTYDTDYD